MNANHPNVARKPRTPKSTPPSGPTIEQIRQRAYEIYCSRRGAPGDALQDWLQAERELRSTRS